MKPTANVAARQGRCICGGLLPDWSEPLSVRTGTGTVGEGRPSDTLWVCPQCGVTLIFSHDTTHDLADA